MKIMLSGHKPNQLSLKIHTRSHGNFSIYLCHISTQCTSNKYFFYIIIITMQIPKTLFWIQNQSIDSWESILRIYECQECYWVPSSNFELLAAFKLCWVKLGQLMLISRDIIYKDALLYTLAVARLGRLRFLYV